MFRWLTCRGYIYVHVDEWIDAGVTCYNCDQTLHGTPGPACLWPRHNYQTLSSSSYHSRWAAPRSSDVMMCPDLHAYFLVKQTRVSVGFSLGSEKIENASPPQQRFEHVQFATRPPNGPSALHLVNGAAPSQFMRDLGEQTSLTQVRRNLAWQPEWSARRMNSSCPRPPVPNDINIQRNSEELP